MGLLSKAVLRTPNNNESYSHGGLLKLISTKSYFNSEPDSKNFKIRSLNDYPSSSMEKTLMGKLSAIHDKFGIFQGLILEAPKYSAGEFSSRLAYMVSGFGFAQDLSPGRCLILFGITQDSELIEQHLAKTVPGKSIFCFQAKNPQEAFLLIKPYLLNVCVKST